MLNPKKKRKECYFAGILLAAAAISLLSGCCGGTPSLEEALKKTASYEQTSIPPRLLIPSAAEWTVIALARSGEEAEDGYYEKYRANLEKRVKEQEGVLSENRYTEYARAVLACKAIGIDPSDIGGYDLGKPLDDFEAVTGTGIKWSRVCPSCLKCGPLGDRWGAGTKVSDLHSETGKAIRRIFLR